jgi:thiol-disulfide isomerase/thioredoxin
MNETITVGPLLVPAVLPAFLGGYLLALTLNGRLKSRYPSESEWFSRRFGTALLIAFVLWKLWPLAQWSREILDDPIILLRLPGGRTGIILGISAAVTFLAFGVFRNPRRGIPVAAGLSGFGTGFLFVIALVGTVAATDSPGVQSDISHLDVEYIQGASEAEGAQDKEETSFTDTLISGRHPAVITFWATWCGPCEAELPVKKRFYSEHGQSVDFVAVNMTTSEQSVGRVVRYLEDHSIDYPVVLDRRGNVSGLFNVPGTPTTVVMTPDGRVSAQWTGPSSLDRLVREVHKAREAP